MRIIWMALTILGLIFLAKPIEDWSAANNPYGSMAKYVGADGEVVYYRDPLGDPPAMPAGGATPETMTTWANSWCQHWYAEPADYKKDTGCHVNSPNTAMAHPVLDPSAAHMARNTQKAADDARKICDQLATQGYHCNETTHS